MAYAGPPPQCGCVSEQRGIERCLLCPRADVSLQRSKKEHSVSSGDKGDEVSGPSQPPEEPSRVKRSPRASRASARARGLPGCHNLSSPHRRLG